MRFFVEIIEFLKTKTHEDLYNLFIQKRDELMNYNKTEEKQAINMAMLLLADDLACQCIFKNEKLLYSLASDLKSLLQILHLKYISFKSYNNLHFWQKTSLIAFLRLFLFS